MSKYFKATFDTDESQRTINVPVPRENITQDEAKDAMEAIVASQAIDGVTAVVKGVMYTSDSELIYEA